MSEFIVQYTSTRSPKWHLVHESRFGDLVLRHTLCGTGNKAQACAFLHAPHALVVNKPWICVPCRAWYERMHHA